MLKHWGSAARPWSVLLRDSGGARSISGQPNFRSFFRETTFLESNAGEPPMSGGSHRAGLVVSKQNKKKFTYLSDYPPILLGARRPVASARGLVVAEQRDELLGHGGVHLSPFPFLSFLYQNARAKSLSFRSSLSKGFGATLAASSPPLAFFVIFCSRRSQDLS